MKNISNADFDSLIRYVPVIIEALDKEVLMNDNRLYNAVRLTGRIIKKMKRYEDRVD